jgi:hypothetical protein
MDDEWRTITPDMLELGPEGVDGVVNFNEVVQVLRWDEFAKYWQDFGIRKAHYFGLNELDLYRYRSAGYPAPLTEGARCPE